MIKKILLGCILTVSILLVFEQNKVKAGGDEKKTIQGKTFIAAGMSGCDCTKTPYDCKCTVPE